MTVSAISAELLIFWQPNLIRWYIIISWNVLFKNQIVVFKVKITVKVKHLIESLCIHIYCVADLIATKEGVLIYYSW